jgi:hypothetical protein
MSVRPLFVVSQPRSGSTLVQRVLASRSEISTASEPWLLIPFLAALRGGPEAYRCNSAATIGIQDFSQQLPGGVDDLYRSLHDFAIGLYGAAAGSDAVYFLDKTPGYSLFLPELLNTFPEAKFVVVWRNPLSVVASVVNTFCNGRWRPDRYPISLYDALDALVEGYGRHRDRMIAVRYEDLVCGEAPWRRITDHLELDFDSRTLSGFNALRLEGRLGDQAGTASYTRLSDQPIRKWTETINTPLRRAWCRRYLGWIGEDRLALMGYSRTKLQESLESTPVRTRGLGRDLIDTADSRARRLVSSRLTARDADVHSQRASGSKHGTTTNDKSHQAERRLAVRR